ncbi:trichohyalin-like isoform X2 [Labrus mixtus]|uniref:trichohyalin-like isoform X2 n=1 Tax=Labrus mixtus TaxID=508554 RepID=UPI0029C0BCF6|nr:trichohyalin-like isoform X2 [Labrus mixtus]
MFRSSCRSSSPFSLTDLDMWDNRSHFTAQTSTWCGMAAVSGTGCLSKVSTSTCGSTGGFRQNDPGLRKWQSLSHLEAAPRPFPPSPGAEMRAARGECSLRQAEAGRWMQDVHERLDTQLRNRKSQLSYNKTTTQLLDMKHKLSEAMTAFNLEKEAAEFSQRGELHEKVLQLEKELFQMRSSLGRGNADHPNPVSLSKTLPSSEEDLSRQESHKVDTELHTLREALREAEARAKTQEEERNQALQKLQTSTETQRTLLNQIEEMRLSHTRQNHAEIQEQLSEANNKISQACLEKAILTTQVIKLEDNIKDLKSKLEKAGLQQRNQVLELQLKRSQQGSDGCEDTESKNNKQDQKTVVMREESKALKEVNEKLIHELDMTKQKLTTSQCQLQEITAERDTFSRQTAEMKEEHSQHIKDKDQLISKLNQGGHEELTEMKEKCGQLRKSVDVLESEKLKLQDQCLRLKAEVHEKEEKLHLQEEEFQKQDAARVQTLQELKAVASHWTEKWQKAALTLQATQGELEELKKNNFRNGRESESLLRLELGACRQELELERSRNQLLAHVHKGDKAVRDQDTETVTDLSQSSLLCEPPSDSQTSKNKTPQVHINQRMAKAEEDLREKEDALKSVEGLRETELNKAQLRISPLELKVKDDQSSYEGNKDTTVGSVNPETEQQRRMVTEQLKSLFKDREARELQTGDNSPGAALTEASSLQDQSHTKAMRKTGGRRIWAQSSGLLPVFEEDEESSECSGGEEAKPTEVAAEMSDHTVDAGIVTLKAKHENLLRGEVVSLKSKQPVHTRPQAAENLSDRTPDVEVADIPNTSDENSLKKKRSDPIYPDGIFQAELVDICSPDEDEEEGVDK